MTACEDAVSILHQSNEFNADVPRTTYHIVHDAWSVGDPEYCRLCGESDSEDRRLLQLSLSWVQLAAPARDAGHVGVRFPTGRRRSAGLAKAVLSDSLRGSAIENVVEKLT